MLPSFSYKALSTLQVTFFSYDFLLELSTSNANTLYTLQTNTYITTHLEELSVEISGHKLDGSLSWVVGGPDPPQVDKDGLDCPVNALKIVGSMELMDWSVFHKRVVVIHLLLSFLQT